jgi:transposase
MGKSYSSDLRERVVKGVEREGLSRRKAAARF